MSGPRWVAKMYAKANGYFWLPCDVCGEEFGGHECGDEALNVGPRGLGRIVCYKPECNEYARKHNAALAEAGLSGYVNVPARLAAGWGAKFEAMGHTEGHRGAE